MKRYPFFLLFPILVAGFAILPQQVRAEKPYYQGKTIEILGESRVGGGTDTVARITATVLPKHIPGKPKIVVRTMPGGAGAIANNIFYEKGKPDGLHLLQNSSSPIALQLRSRDIAKYDLLAYKHIGNIARGGNMMVVRKEALERVFDPKAEPVVCGTKEGEETWMAMPIWGREYLGWNIRWIPGYSGTSDMELALRRGEIDMMGTSNAFIINRLKDEGLVTILCQGGSYKRGKFVRRPDFPDVRTFVETLEDKKPTGRAWRAYVVWVGGNLVDKLLSAPRGTPDKYVSILVDAYGKMAKDPQFDKLMKRMVTEVYDVGTGEETAELLREVLDVPQDVLDYGIDLQRKFGIIAK
jgi:tripartite-type tricarboxylate transporter receptor subunit TctC